MNRRTYCYCLRRIYRKYGIVISCIIAILGVYSLALSSDILDSTLFKWVSIHNRVDDGLIRLLSSLMLLASVPLFGLTSKFKEHKDSNFAYGVLYSYPLLSIGLATIFVSTVLNLAIGNKFEMTYLFRLMFQMSMVGLFEELLFRGIIQNILLDKLSKANWIFAIFLQAVIFGVAHIGNSTEGLDKYIQCIFSCMAGFFFGLSYYMSKSLLSSIFVHALYDFSLSFYSTFSIFGSHFKIETGFNWWTVTMAALLCVFFFLYKIYYENKKKICTLSEVEAKLGLEGYYY